MTKFFFNFRNKKYRTKIFIWDRYVDVCFGKELIWIFLIWIGKWNNPEFDLFDIKFGWEIKSKRRDKLEHFLEGLQISWTYLGVDGATTWIGKKVPRKIFLSFLQLNTPSNTVILFYVRLSVSNSTSPYRFWIFLIWFAPKSRTFRDRRWLIFSITPILFENR